MTVKRPQYDYTGAAAGILRGPNGEVIARVSPGAQVIATDEAHEDLIKNSGMFSYGRQIEVPKAEIGTPDPAVVATVPDAPAEEEK